jgi:cell division protein FtsW (lipid II flippase)
MHHALEANSNMGRLLTLGAAGVIAVPFSLHVAINLGLLPVTGLALPFMSYGGSHTLVEWIALGLAMAAAKSG